MLRSSGSIVRCKQFVSGLTRRVLLPREKPAVEDQSDENIAKMNEQVCSKEEE